MSIDLIRIRIEDAPLLKIGGEFGKVADAAVSRKGSRQVRLEIPDLALPFGQNQLSVQDHADPGGVVAPVLQTFQSLDQDLLRALGSEVANDSTHVFYLTIGFLMHTRVVLVLLFFFTRVFHDDLSSGFDIVDWL